MSRSIIWNSDLVGRTLEKLRYGAEVNLSCFHERDPELKASNILFQLTPREEEEFIKCSEDIEYFVSVHCRFLTDLGRMIVDLRPYQEDILSTIGEEEWIEELGDFGPKVRNYILMAARQVGKTTTIASFFAWYLCFHVDRNLLIIANKQQTTAEIVSKVVDVFRGLPFFLKPGILNIGALGLRLDNGCMLTSQATTKTAAIGFAIHVLYIDEFAHINQKMVKNFWRSVYPTLSSSKISQCIISSTPNGRENLFFDIWDKAERGLNSFVSKRVDYWEVPGHDEKWAEKMRRDFGEEEFAQEFELSFDRQSNLLLSASQLAWISKLKKTYKSIELDKTDLEEDVYRGKLLWHPGFDPNLDFSSKEWRFVLSNDLAEGKDIGDEKDNDFNVTAIYSIEPRSLSSLRKLKREERSIQNMFRMREVGIWRDNFGDEEVMASVNKALVFDQFNSDICKLVTEMNFNGKAFIGKLSDHDEFYDEIILHTYHTKPIPGEAPPRKKMGYKTGSDKDYFCKLGRKLIDKRIIIPSDKETVKEFYSFGRVGGSWRGVARHDDCVMTSLNLSRLWMEEEYEDWLTDFLEEMQDCPQKELINELLKNGVEVEDSNWYMEVLKEDTSSFPDISELGPYKSAGF